MDSSSDIAIAHCVPAKERGICERKNISLTVGLAYGEWLKIGREIEQAALQKIAEESDYFGEVNQTQTFQLQFLKSFSVGGIFDPAELVIGVLAGTPHKFAWYNNGKVWYKLGETYQVKAFVKAHEEHEKYGKQTKINRVKKMG